MEGQPILFEERCNRGAIKPMQPREENQPGYSPWRSHANHGSKLAFRSRPLRSTWRLHQRFWSQEEKKIVDLRKKDPTQANFQHTGSRRRDQNIFADPCPPRPKKKAVRQPSIAAAGHSLLAVSATIFWFQNQTLTIPSRGEIERAHSIHTFFVWEWCWEKERRLLWSFDIIEGRGLDLKPLNRVPSASPVPRALTSKGSHWEKQKLLSERSGL